MPKLKTNRAAAKRFRKTAKGFKGYAAGRRHNLGHKDPQGQAPCCAPAAPASCDKTRCRPSDPAASESQVTRALPTMARVKRGVTAGAVTRKFWGRRRATTTPVARSTAPPSRRSSRPASTPTATAAQKKREFRALWITRINAAARLYGLTYSRLINGLIRPASRSTARCSPISRCTTRPPLARSPSRPRPLSASSLTGAGRG